MKGRFAPSPTGVLHLGNLRTALASWLSARAQNGEWIIRMEDVDGPRSRPDVGLAQLRDLEALGLVSDETILWQSQRTQAYQAALEALEARSQTYGCACTRKDLATIASAPHAEDGLKPYPGRCRDRHLPGAAQRFRLPEGEISWTDLLLGEQRDDPAQLTGDPLLHRRDGCFAYHLAVVLDDGFQGVTEIVRGRDLRSVTATQIRLQEALDLPRPRYAHVGMVTAPDGARLGKRDGALGLAALKARGLALPEILGWLGWSLGCLDRPEPCAARELVGTFAWGRVPTGDIAVPVDWI